MDSAFKWLALCLITYLVYRVIVCLLRAHNRQKYISLLREPAKILSRDDESLTLVIYFRHLGIEYYRDVSCVYGVDRAAYYKIFETEDLQLLVDKCNGYRVYYGQEVESFWDAIVRDGLHLKLLGGVCVTLVFWFML